MSQSEHNPREVEFNLYENYWMAFYEGHILWLERNEEELHSHEVLPDTEEGYTLDDVTKDGSFAVTLTRSGDGGIVAFITDKDTEWSYWFNMTDHSRSTWGFLPSIEVPIVEEDN